MSNIEGETSPAGNIVWDLGGPVGSLHPAESGTFPMHSGRRGANHNHQSCCPGNRGGESANKEFNCEGGDLQPAEHGQGACATNCLIGATVD